MIDPFWSAAEMAKPHRTATLIALRARRQALHVARDIAFPRIKTRPTHTLPVGELESGERFRPRYERFPCRTIDRPPDMPAPWWMKWIAASAVFMIIAAWMLSMMAMGLGWLP
jgi:hypothetical protein